MILSMVLHQQLIRDIGPYLDVFLESLPGLGIGITVASFQHSGILPEDNI